MNSEVIKALMAMASIYDKTLTESAAEMIVSDLSGYEPAKILSALRICRLELNRFPTIAEIIKRMSEKSDLTQVQDIIGKIFKAINWYGYTNPEGAKNMIGDVGWKAVEFFGGWQQLCDSPSDDLSILRGQLRKSIEAAAEEKTRCEALGIPFLEHTPRGSFQVGNKSPMKTLDFSNFIPKEPA